MELTYKKSFIKELKRVPASIQKQAGDVFNKLVIAKKSENSGVDFTKMHGQNANYFRIRIGSYCIGCEYVEPNIVIITIMSRGDIYKHFPPK